MANNRYDESDHLFPYLEKFQKEISSEKNLEACVEEVQPDEKTMRQGKGDVMGMLADLISDK